MSRNGTFVPKPLVRGTYGPKIRAGISDCAVCSYTPCSGKMYLELVAGEWHE